MDELIRVTTQASLPLGQEADVCRRCNGARTVYYMRRRCDVVGGKRIPCPECTSVKGLTVRQAARRAGKAGRS